MMRRTISAKRKSVNLEVAKSLAQWLDHISAVHPTEIELGLERVAAVAAELNVLQPAPQVVTVAGTNGKGSTVASLETMLLASNKTVGAFTSPHIHRFNERIRIAGTEVVDADICSAFQLIEEARGAISLSYFEFATLAALILFKTAKVDVAVLEVGLGGRLDSVNIVDSDIAVITSISLDHQDWLGSDLEGIGFEKAGILRENCPVVLANTIMPKSVLKRAEQLKCRVYQLGQAFDYSTAVDSSGCWHWRGQNKQGKSRTISDLEATTLHYGSVSASVQVLELLNYSLTAETLSKVLNSLNLAGRFEQRIDQVTGAAVILDVAHNPAAAIDLNGRLLQMRQGLPENARMIAVIAVLNDKDIEGIVVSLLSSVDIWYIAQVEGDRRLAVEYAVSRVREACPHTQFTAFQSVEAAYSKACSEANPVDRVVVAGSFHTVSSVRELSRAL